MRSKLKNAFFESFKKGLSGFSLRREDPEAPIVFGLEPREFYQLTTNASENSLTRLSGVLGYLIPSLLFTLLAIVLESEVPTTIVFSTTVTQGVAFAQAVLLGAILCETFRVFRVALLQSSARYVFLASLLAIVLTLQAWPNATILLCCGAYATLHSSLDVWLRKRSSTVTLRLDPLVMLAALSLVTLGAWGSPWVAMALLNDIWADNVMSGQLARSCVWAALGPSILPVLLLHLAYSRASWAGFAVMALGIGLVFFVLGKTSRQQTQASPVIATAFYGGFVPALALLCIGALSPWPEDIQWNPLLFFVILLGFALRWRGWNIKILLSLSLVVLFVRTIVESL